MPVCMRLQRSYRGILETTNETRSEVFIVEVVVVVVVVAVAAVVVTSAIVYNVLVDDP